MSVLVLFTVYTRTVYGIKAFASIVPGGVVRARPHDSRVFTPVVCTTSVSAIAIPREALVKRDPFGFYCVLLPCGLWPCADARRQKSTECRVQMDERDVPACAVAVSPPPGTLRHKKKRAPAPARE